MVVQQHILNWLYSVLTSEYHDVNRTYDDVAQALSLYPSLSPRTDVHTFPNGVSALLLHLSGTIPVVFRGTTYRFPISLWVPHAYPREAPLVYVTPTENMVVRPGQHVDPQGQVYHPYLVGWAGFWDKSAILDFLAILRDVFAKEPPVIAKQQQQQQQQGPAPAQLPTATPPPNLARPASAAHTHVQTPAPAEQRPPPPPPKGDDPPIHRPSPVPPQSRSVAPPVPPYGAQGHHPVSQAVAPEATAMRTPASNRASRYDSAPPLPPQPHYAGSQTSQAGPPPPVHPPYHHPQSPPGHLQRQTTPAAAAAQGRESFSPGHASFPPPQHASQGAPPPTQPQVGWQQQQQQQQPPPSQQYDRYQQTGPLQQQRHPHPPPAAGGPPPSQPMAAPPAPPQQPAQKPPPPPDLMDEPLRALADAVFVLGRAVERGRVSPAVFAKTTRSLAREWYLKKALVRKIGRGMGLIQQ
ncbi:ESCRT-I component [Magnaporthiopsis poae ATCC 64411]|uniref:ESCRT-I component n=1 Tax=Magnaporthiopsis poae (strain ATCC 64411 / 73-15) TaxID=644358 RepID=A0A0C4DS70_MAGP6|nr:ESCRT-I component [Magnaporthiopsis poae ATCC 64411]